MPSKKGIRDIFTPMGSAHPSRHDTSIAECLVFDLTEVDRAVKRIKRLFVRLELEGHVRLCDEARNVLARQINAFGGIG